SGLKVSPVTEGAHARGYAVGVNFYGLQLACCNKYLLYDLEKGQSPCDSQGIFPLWATMHMATIPTAVSIDVSPDKMAVQVSRQSGVLKGQGFAGSDPVTK